MKDERKRPSINVEFIPDGFYKSYTDEKQIPYFYYLGENSIIKKITEYELANSTEDIITKINGISNTSPQPNTKTLVGISGPSEILYMDNKPYYAFSLDYVELPPQLTPPENKKKNIRTQINSSGFTLNGDPIIAGGSKGLIITESYIGKDDKNFPKQGETNDNGYLITSVSKNNKRYINNELYYDITITLQEL